MKFDKKKIKKILIVQPGPFGDVLLNSSYLPELKRSFPDATIDFLLKKPFDQVLANNPYLNRILVFSSPKGSKYLVERLRIFKEIFLNKYDLLIDQQNDTFSGQVALFSNARYRLCFKGNRWSFAFNMFAPRGADRYSGSCKFDLLKPLGISEIPYKLYFHILPESMQYISEWFKDNNLPENKLICFSPGSPQVWKKWILDNYVKLADLIQKQTSYRVVLLWGPKELADVNYIKDRMETNPIIAPPTNFNQAAAFLKKVRMLICNDGGINHLAAATETTTLAIFGCTNTVYWSPAQLFKHHHHLKNESFDSLKDFNFGITPEDVFHKMLEILEDESKQA